MTERKTQSRLRQLDLEALAHLLDPAHPILHVLRRRAVVVVGIGLDSRRKNAGIERTADHDANTPFQAKRQETRQRFLFEKRVAPGEEKEVEIASASEDLGEFPLIDPPPDRLDRARRAQLFERPISARHEFLDARLRGFLAAVGVSVDIMGVDDIDMVEAESLE